jgi:hypothetical protein
MGDQEASAPQGETKKVCFVISPIGEENTDVRRRSDQLLRHIITPAVRPLGYAVTRADDDPKPGIITTQIIQQLNDADLVIADLTDHNPNVFYELGVRHALQKPTIHLLQDGQKLPFDVGQYRTIFYRLDDFDHGDRCRSEIKAQLQEIEKDPSLIDTPFSTAIEIQSLRRSENPLMMSTADILEQVQSLSTVTNDIYKRLSILGQRMVNQIQVEKNQNASLEELLTLMRRLAPKEEEEKAQPDDFRGDDFGPDDFQDPFADQ